VPRKKKAIEFKITRGNWNSVEVDKYGFDIPNRVIQPGEADTMYIDIESWNDYPGILDDDVTLIIDRLPPRTPDGSKFFVTGNFNGWAPGRSRFSFIPGQDGKPFINIPRGKGLLEFKITRGSWENPEVDRYGSEIPNRVFFYKDIDTVYLSIVNWRDLPPLDLPDVTLVINKLPADTPGEDNLFLASGLNDWDPGDRRQVFYYLPDSRPYITVMRRGTGFEYKITRGNWATVETDAFGDPISNRTLTFGFADTVFIHVEKWRDLGGRY
jgi:hypothetical protein